MAQAADRAERDRSAVPQTLAIAHLAGSLIKNEGGAARLHCLCALAALILCSASGFRLSLQLLSHLCFQGLHLLPQQNSTCEVIPVSL